MRRRQAITTTVTTLFCAIMAMATTIRSWKPPPPPLGLIRRQGPTNIISRGAAAAATLSSNKKNKQPVTAKTAPFLVRQLPTHSFHNNVRLFSAASSNNHNPNHSNKSNIQFQPGDKIQVEVLSFGPLGASVNVIAHGSHDQADLLPETAPPLATGLILQREIAYFRQARHQVDVVRGEILPAYVERIRSDDDDNDDENDDDTSSSSSSSDDDNDDPNNKKKNIRLDIGLRPFGGKAKTVEVAQLVLDRLEFAPPNGGGGVLELGDKSTPAEIARQFPGVSKGTFKKAIGALYRQGKIKQPEPNRIRLAEVE